MFIQVPSKYQARFHWFGLLFIWIIKNYRFEEAVRKEKSIFSMFHNMLNQHGDSHAVNRATDPCRYERHWKSKLPGSNHSVALRKGRCIELFDVIVLDITRSITL